VRVMQTIGSCPCETTRCTAIGTKLTRAGHLVGCGCASCMGRRNRKKGQAAQSRVLKDAARAEGITMEIAPTHEEQARLLVHYESKSGTSLPRAFSGEWMRKAEQQAREFAHRQVPRRKWAVVFTMAGGSRRIWMDYEDWLTLVAEIMEVS
jgi:hypothetical protein